MPSALAGRVLFRLGVLFSGPKPCFSLAVEQRPGQGQTSQRPRQRTAQGPVAPSCPHSSPSRSVPALDVVTQPSGPRDALSTKHFFRSMLKRAPRQGQKPPLEAKLFSSRSYLVLGVEDDGLGVGHPHDVMVEAGRRQPGARRQLVVQQRQLRDEPLRLLLFGRQGGQALPDGDQGFDEFSLGGESDRLQKVWGRRGGSVRKAAG